jgi:steroid delta-isomerase-like uncharacterized protein
MSEENKKLVREIFEQAWNQGNFTLLEENLAADYVGHSPPKDIEGPEGGKQFITMMRHAFPGFEYIIEDEIAEGDRVVNRWTARGTHRGPFQGLPPTGRQFSIAGIGIYRVANGKLVEGWTSADLLGLMGQLGALPAPAQSA